MKGNIPVSRRHVQPSAFYTIGIFDQLATSTAVWASSSILMWLDPEMDFHLIVIKREVVDFYAIAVEQLCDKL